VVSFGPADRGFSGNCTDAAGAALALARLGDRSVLERVRELAGKATAEDKQVLEEALEVLSGGK